MQHKIVYIGLVVILSVGLIASIFGYYSVSIQLSESQAKLATQKKDERVLSFLDMFINKVIKAKQEIGFEDRLELENAVRQLSDNDVLAQWKKFTDSKTESEAQSNTKDLLVILVNKISKK